MNDKQLHTVIKLFNSKIKDWRDKSIHGNIEFIYNKDLDELDINKIKLILVGDNPGESEKEKEKYFVEDTNKNSSAGNNLARFLKAIGYQRDEILILNKTPIYTPKTDGLEKIESEILKETQEYMADLLYKIHVQIPEVPAMINGLAGCFDPADRCWLKQTEKKTYYKNEILPHFFAKISSLYMKNPILVKNLIILKHFAYWKIFDDFCFENDSTGQTYKLRKVNKLSIKHFENKDASFEEFIKVSKELDYVDTLLKIKEN